MVHPRSTPLVIMMRREKTALCGPAAKAGLPRPLEWQMLNAALSAVIVQVQCHR